MNRRQKIIVSVTGIFLVALILIGLTYAYFLTQITGNTNSKSISISTANLQLRYDDGTDGILTKESIIPNTIIGTKTFSVINEGDGTVDSYSVILNDLKISYVNTFTQGTETITGGTATYLEYPNDFKLRITCSSSKSGKTCNGLDGVLPTTNAILLSNSIDKDETQTYRLELEYVDSGTNQSKDMNKRIEAKIDIVDTKNTIDIAGNIENAKLGDFVEVEKDDVAYINGEEVKLLGNETTDKLRSYLDKEGNYKIVGVKPGNYKVTLKDKSEATSSTTDIKIQKGQESNVDTTNKVVTIVDDSRKITLDVEESGFALDQAVKGEDSYLKNVIIASAKKAKSENSSTRTIFYDKDEILPSNPGQPISSENERVLGMAEDDYTVITNKYSYYFRGNVDDNYLEFNNMCWRIVRIEGDGSVKIALAAEKKCSEITDSDVDSASIANDNYGNKIIDNINYPDYENPQVMYSAKNILNKFINGGSYINGDLLNGGSTTTKNYIGWDEGIKSIIKPTKICLGNTDKKYNDKGNELTDSEAMSLKKWNYESYVRLFNDKNPQLKCEVGGQSNNFYQIYLLTADEEIYAGAMIASPATSMSGNSQYYLRDNATRSFGGWLVLTTGSINSYMGSPFRVYNNGTFFTDHYDDIRGGYFAIRPVVSLIDGIELASDSGDGTINSPYKIVES